jgi:NAD(P)-dependent dehydrogenase (short-subunit alcohol dehydrogenase family)
MTWALNHMAPFLLTMNYSTCCVRSAGWIITVASAAHQGAKIDFDDLEGKKHFGGWKAYGQSKARQYHVYLLNWRIDCWIGCHRQLSASWLCG